MVNRAAEHSRHPLNSLIHQFKEKEPKISQFPFPLPRNGVMGHPFLAFTAPLVHPSICVIISDCRHLHAARPTQHHRGADGEQAWQHGSAAHGGVCNAGWTNGSDKEDRQ